MSSVSLVHGQEVDVEHLGGQLAAALVHESDRLRHPQGAAVAADAVGKHLLHHRIDRDALLHGRQLAGGNPGRQHRRLAEPPAHRRTGASAGGRALLRIAGSKRERRRHQQRAGCQPSPRHPNLHHGILRADMVAQSRQRSNGPRGPGWAGEVRWMLY